MGGFDLAMEKYRLAIELGGERNRFEARIRRAMEKKQQQQQQIESLIAKGDEALKRWDKDGAISYYKKALALGGDSVLLSARIEKVKKAKPRAGQVWKDPYLGMEFVWVPGGCYEMGCGSWTSSCYGDEKPVHEVCVDGFWMGRYEVTQGQWKKVMGNNPSYFKKGDNYPVEKVSWNDAQKFIEKLNAHYGGKYTFRLPTEAEWEYACRSGGKKIKYPWGNELGRNNANCDGCGSRWDDESTAPVGSFTPNSLGLYDMSGNVWEWVEDVYSKHAYGQHSRRNPIYTGSGSDRVLRGGSWGSNPRCVRCAHRGVISPGNRYNDLGFRLARTK